MRMRCCLALLTLHSTGFYVGDAARYVRAVGRRPGRRLGQRRHSCRGPVGQAPRRCSAACPSRPNHDILRVQEGDWARGLGSAPGGAYENSISGASRGRAGRGAARGASAATGGDLGARRERTSAGVHPRPSAPARLTCARRFTARPRGRTSRSRYVCRALCASRARCTAAVGPLWPCHWSRARSHALPYTACRAEAGIGRGEVRAPTPDPRAMDTAWGSI